MRGTRDDEVARAAAPAGPPPSPQYLVEPSAPPAGLNTLGLAAGAVLAVAATLAVFLTDDARYLRVAVVAVAWAFVGAAVLAGRRGTDQAAAAAREDVLRRRHERELEREVAARYEHQLELESRLRRESQDAVRAELTQLRRELAGLSQLRTELAGLTELRGELARIRTELGGQHSGELTFERMVMRAASVRTAAPAGSAERAPQPIAAPPPVPVPVRADRTTAPPPPPAPAAPLPAAPAPQPVPHRHHRAAEPADHPVAVPATARTPAVGTAAPAGVSSDGARHDHLLVGAASPDQPSGAPAWAPPSTTGREPATRVGQEPEPELQARPEPQGHAGLAQILADSGVAVPTGGRSRRRRYRDEDGGTAGDDVLARVLGRR
jgi:hypothetical protein